MKSWIARALVLGMLASLLMVGPSASGAAVKIKAKGTAGNYDFAPTFPHVAKGRKVKWVNTTSVFHNLTFYDGRWDGKRFDLPGNGSFAKKPRKNGEYFYRCTIHSTFSSGNCNGMCGAFHVSKD